jgi:TetR/AcrR family transcriptional regulator
MSKGERRQQILEAFALMLETSPGSRITTAALARQVGVSEAALYRHFPSKAKMFEGLIEFMEATIFTRITLILEEDQTAAARSRNVLWLLLTFAERNPGFARLMAGDALQGESERLHGRMRQFFDRIETQLKQIVREGIARREIEDRIPPAAAANLLLSLTDGRINQFVRSRFRARPTVEWNAQWPLLAVGLFGMLVERLIIRWLYGRIVDTLLATWGLSLFLVGAITTLFGPQANRGGWNRQKALAVAAYLRDHPPSR